MTAPSSPVHLARLAWRRMTTEGGRDARRLVIVAAPSPRSLGGVGRRSRRRPQGFSARVDQSRGSRSSPGRPVRYEGVKDGKPSREVVTVTHQTKIDRRRALRRRLRTGSTSTATSRSGRPTGTRRTRRATSGTSARRRPSSTGNGHVTSTEGTWLAGVDGAKPGIFMPAHPQRRPDGRARSTTRARRRTTSGSSACLRRSTPGRRERAC